MISNTKLKQLSVYKQQKRCDEDSVFVVEGVKMCNEAMASNMPVRVVCATNLWLSQHTSLPNNAQVFEVTEDDLHRLGHLAEPNEVWMLLERHLPLRTLEAAIPITIALDHLQDPGNMGTIIRTADWFGIRHIVCSPQSVSCFNPKVVQSTMGGLFRTAIEYHPLPEYLATCGKPVFGAVLDGENIWNTPSHIMPESGCVLVIGNESRGITPEVQSHLTRRIAIPNIGGTAESLNAAVACAILLAELCRSVVKPA